jgi:hypothetical protein
MTIRRELNSVRANPVPSYAKSEKSKRAACAAPSPDKDSLWWPFGCGSPKPEKALFRAAAIWLLALFAVPGLAAVISVTPDRNPVRMDESFNLIFSADEKPDDDPDFRPLEKDLEILSQSQSSQISVVNGRFSRRTEWTLTVAAKRTGTLNIPPIPFGNDRSEPVAIVVDAAPGAANGAGSDLFLEVEAEPEDPYVQAQVIYTVRVLRRVNISGADLSEPAAPDALVQRLGDDRRYASQRGGQQYAVIERKYAIFPQKSGTLRIEPLTLQAQVVDGARSRFNSFFSQSTRLARVRSEAVELKVRPVPTAFAGQHWLPAESLELLDAWSPTPPETTAGEPITRTLTLRAQGATVGLLPELSENLQSVDGIKRYPDQPVMNEEKRAQGIFSVREEKTALIPSKPGTYRLPPLEIPWWNTKTDRPEVARLPERVMDVQPSAEQTAQPAAPPKPAPSPQARGPEPVPSDSSSQIRAPTSSETWFWLALLFGFGWLGTAAAWWFSGRGRNATSIEDPARASGTQAARSALRQACLANDPVKARQALLDWAKTHWPDRAPGTLGELGRLAGGALAAETQRLDRALYGRAEHAWRGEALWTAVEAVTSADSRDKKAPALALEPLYRL